MKPNLLERLGLALGVSLTLWAAAGAAHADKIDDYVRAQMARQHIPAAAVAVVKGGKAVKVQAYGTANLELGVAARPESVFKIGSLSKQFIASGIVVLSQDGKLKLDDPVGKYLTDAPDSWKPITLRHLLTHTSGLVREAPGFDQLKAQADIDVIRTAYPLPLAYETGKGWDYSNLGYFVLAEVITRAGGKPWPQFMRERVFGPAGMAATRETSPSDLIANRADGYEWTDGRYRNAAELLALRPSGAFASTIQDLVKWEAALRSDRLLTGASREAMMTAVALADGSTKPYGYGWQVGSFNGHRQINHGGTLPGFRAEYARYVDDDVTVIVLTNASAAIPDRIAKGVAAQFIPGLIKQRASVAVPAATLDAYVGRYALSGGRIIHVTREGQKLQMAMTAGTLNMDLGELSAESPTRFFIADNPASTYVFGKDDKGRMQLVTENEQGKPGPAAPRVE